MRILKAIVLVLCLVLDCGIILRAQKKVLGPEDYSLWRRVDQPMMSEDGRWVAYRLVWLDPEKQQAEVPVTFLRDMHTGQEHRLERVRHVEFFNRGKWLKYNILRSPEDTLGKDTTCLLALRNMKKIVWEREYDFRESHRSPLLLYSYPYIADRPADTRLVCWNIESGDSTVLEHVARYRLSDGEKNITYIREENGKKELRSGPLNGKHRVIYREEQGKLDQFSLQGDGETGVFTVISDTTTGKKADQVYTFNSRTGHYRLILDTRGSELPGGYQVNASTYHLINGGRSMFVDVSPLVAEPRREEKKEEPAFAPEIWRWDDEEVPIRRRGSYRSLRPVRPKYIYHIEEKQYVLVTEDDQLSFSTPFTDNYTHALLLDDQPYRRFSDWQDGTHQDITWVDLTTGEQVRLFTDFRGRPEWSPDGKYTLFYHGPEKRWLSLDVATREIRDISSAIGFPVFNEKHDRPEPAPSYGIAGWAADGKSVFLYDRYDIWEVALDGSGSPRSVTGGYGREHHLSLRLLKANYDAKVIEPKKGLLLQGVDTETRDQGFYRLSGGGRLSSLMEGPFSYYVHVLSGGSKHLLYTRQNHYEYRDLWWSPNDFSASVRITDANPQRENYRWGSVELVEWTNFAGLRNRGLLYLPENYDPAKKYPVIVNFYETHTEGLHTYQVPDYSSAMINTITYVSQDYIVFMPDVHFVVGAPGESSYNAVVSGTQMLIDKGIADPERIGIQGHSWSGYQTAYILTRTNMFRCANAGAVVSNMVSAYTGIRTQVGMPRMFMYEETQCRIGRPMWGEGNTELYIRNSPIYFADKIETPLLIFHNDADEAVPYSEGLNLFLALRRLQRPAWLLNYKGEYHFVADPDAQRDWTIRLQEFFDYYLKDGTEPEWMR